MNMPDFSAVLAAFAVGLGLALAGRMRRMRWVGRLAGGTGLVVGWWWVFGSFPASPRQLAERLPLLALAALGFGALVPPVTRLRVPPAAPLILAAAGVGWWMAGAPRTLADLGQAAPAGLAIALYVLALLRHPRWAPLAAAALLAGLAWAGLPGPAVLLGAVLLAATVGSAPATVPSALPMAAGLAALGALPVLARGAAMDWIAAALPVAVLWLLPPLAARYRPSSRAALLPSTPSRSEGERPSSATMSSGRSSPMSKQ